MEQFIKAYFDQKIGWRLFMPDGTEVPSLCRASVTIDDNWGDKPTPFVKIEMPCEVVNELPK
jgi:hypothetical protein